MQKKVKKLVLHRETLVSLDQQSLQAAVGGGTWVVCPPTRLISGCGPCPPPPPANE